MINGVLYKKLKLTIVEAMYSFVLAKPCCALIVFLATKTVGYSTLPVRVSP